MTRVVIIGGGPGGYEAAFTAARAGASVTILEELGLGGSAVLTDCVPSKTLIATAALMTTTAVSAQTLPATNPFATPSTLPFQAPPFDRIKDTDYLPAIKAGMAQQRAEIARIAALAHHYGVTVIVDELYSRLLYSGQTYTHLRAAIWKPYFIEFLKTLPPVE